MSEARLRVETTTETSGAVAGDTDRNGSRSSAAALRLRLVDPEAVDNCQRRLILQASADRIPDRLGPDRVLEENHPAVAPQAGNLRTGQLGGDEPQVVLEPIAGERAREERGHPDRFITFLKSSRADRYSAMPASKFAGARWWRTRRRPAARGAQPPLRRPSPPGAGAERGSSREGGSQSRRRAPRPPGLRRGSRAPAATRGTPPRRAAQVPDQSERPARRAQPARTLRPPRLARAITTAANPMTGTRYRVWDTERSKIGAFAVLGADAQRKQQPQKGGRRSIAVCDRPSERRTQALQENDHSPRHEAGIQVEPSRQSLPRGAEEWLVGL